MTVTGQRLLQEPEAVSDDDDEGDDTVLGETWSEESESEESECEESENEERESEEGNESAFAPLAKRPCSTRSGHQACMYQVSYSSSVSTFCRNEIKDRNYKSVQQHIFTSFSFSGKKWLPPTPYARCNFRWKFSTAPPKS